MVRRVSTDEFEGAKPLPDKELVTIFAFGALVPLVAPYLGIAELAEPLVNFVESLGIFERRIEELYAIGADQVSFALSVLLLPLIAVIVFARVFQRWINGPAEAIAHDSDEDGIDPTYMLFLLLFMFYVVFIGPFTNSLGQPSKSSPFFVHPISPVVTSFVSMLVGFVSAFLLASFFKPKELNDG